MEVQRLAAFSDGDVGGNPAGVVICDALPGAATMQSIAAEVGYSETAFAAPESLRLRVRYFAPEAEVAFCGHATIALGAALSLRFGDGVFALQLNEATITVEGRRDAGVNHLTLALRSRELLSAMRYDFEVGRSFMTSEGIGTVSLLFAETRRLFHSRNPFAVGGVYEDPATGAAAAALAGYLRDIDWPHAGSIDIVQGEDMGSRSLLRAEISPERSSSIRVSGRVRVIGT